MGSWATALGDYTTVGGGFEHHLNGEYGVVGGGQDNTAAATSYAVMGGGSMNYVSSTAGTVLGGMYNKVMSNYATVLGGFRSKVDSRFSLITGGSKNTINGRFGFTMGYRAKVTGDFSAAISLSEDGCEVRDDTQLGICASQFTIRDSDGNWNDMMDLIDSRARQLKVVDEIAKDADSLNKLHSEYHELNTHQEEAMNIIVKRVDAVASSLEAFDYDASLKAVEALLERVSRV